jgi:hypothetical protein
MVPRILTPEQKETRLNICVDILQNTENDLEYLGYVITSDESWFFQYDPETKHQSMHWKSPRWPRKKSMEEQVKFQAMMIVFFYIWGIVHIDLVPQGQTVNQVYYKEVMTTTCEWVRTKRLEMWKNGSWILHHDNAPAHNALSVKTFLAKH